MSDEEQQRDNAPYAAPINQFGSSIVLLTNPENEIDKLELALRNKRLDKNGKVVPMGDPLMNDEGINSVLSIVASVVNQVTVLSSLGKNERPALIELFADTLIVDLMMNRVKYGIKNPATRYTVFGLALQYVFITMKRADEEAISDKKFWGRSFQEIHSTINQPQKKSSFIPNIFGWGQK